MAAMTEFFEHLRALDYEIEQQEDALWLALHDEYPSAFIVVGRGGFLLRAYLRAIQGALGELPEALVNRVNREAIVARCFVDEDGDAVIEAWHSHAYDREGFDAFLDLWLRDVGMLLEARDAASRTFDA